MDSKFHRKLSMVNTLIRSAHLQAMFQSEEESLSKVDVYARGVVLSTKMKRTIVIRRDYLHYIKKYNRFEKRHKTLSAHSSPAF